MNVDEALVRKLSRIIPPGAGWLVETSRRMKATAKGRAARVRRKRNLRRRRSQPGVRPRKRGKV